MVFVVIVDLLFLLPFVVTVGWLTSRLLGVHLGLWRGVASRRSSAGSSAPLRRSCSGATRADRDWVVIPLVIFFGVLAAMPIAIVLDLITRRAKPSGRAVRRLAVPPDPRDQGGARAVRAAPRGARTTPASRT